MNTRDMNDFPSVEGLLDKPSCVYPYADDPRQESPDTEVRQDEDGYSILPSLWHMYTYSPRMQCYIPKLPDCVWHFEDDRASPVSYKFLIKAGYFLNGYWYSSREAAELDCISKLREESREAGLDRHLRKLHELARNKTS